MVSERVNPIPIEARSYQGRPAGVVTRSTAAVLDIGVVTALLVGLYVAVCTGLFVIDPAGFDPPVPSWWLVVGVGSVSMTGYLAATWKGSGRTYGCHVMGLRVTDGNGGLLSFASAYLRALLCVAFPFGLLWVAVSGSNRSVQDVVLHTSVTYDWDVRPVSPGGHGVSGDPPREIGDTG